MARRIIAVALLFIVTAWAEMLTAPMFTMPAAHPHRSHESAQAMAAQHHAMPGHLCCPRVEAVPVAVPPIELSSASLPCQDNHRCCFRSAPQGAPEPARNDRRPARDLSGAAIAAVHLISSVQPRVVPICLIESVSPSAFGMVARI